MPEIHKPVQTVGLSLRSLHISLTYCFHILGTWNNNACQGIFWNYFICPYNHSRYMVKQFANHLIVTPIVKAIYWYSVWGICSLVSINCLTWMLCNLVWFRLCLGEIWMPVCFTGFITLFAFLMLTSLCICGS